MTAGVPITMADYAESVSMLDSGSSEWEVWRLESARCEMSDSGSSEWEVWRLESA